MSISARDQHIAEIRDFNARKAGEISLTKRWGFTELRVSPGASRIELSDGSWYPTPSVVRILRRWQKHQNTYPREALYFRASIERSNVKQITIAPNGIVCIGCTVFHDSAVRALYAKLAVLGHFGKRAQKEWSEE